jgi:hypothetical protein
MYLYNSQGDEIAYQINDRLYNLNGDNIGCFLENMNFFIGLNGFYLGEIVINNRLMFKRDNPYLEIDFGDRGDTGNIGDLGRTGNIGEIGLVPGFRDIR